MENKHNTYLDLSKLSEEDLKEIYSIIQEDNIDSFTRRRLKSGNTFERYSLINEGDWVFTQLDYKLSRRTELTFSEWKSMMEGTCKDNLQVGDSAENAQVEKSNTVSFILGKIDKKIEELNDVEIARVEGVLTGLKICKEMWAQGTISHENIQEEIYHYQEELDNLNNQ